jgi:competence protein ComEC
LRLAIAGALIWTLTLPLVMYHFHLVSPAALVLNVFLWIPITLALFAGFAVLLIGWLVPPLAALCGWICEAALWMMESSVQVVQPLAASHFWVAGPALWWVVGFYVALGLAATLPWRRNRGKRSLGLIATWIMIGTGISFWHRADLGQPPSELKCTFLAVGHGTSVLIELPNGQNLAYDAGSLGAPHLPVNAISAALWSRGVHHLDAVILSHADADHYNAVPGLLERFTVGVVYVSPVMFDDPNEAVDVLRAAIERAQVPIETIHQGRLLPLGDATRLHVLHPPRLGTFDSDNASSIVLDIRFAGRRVILTGDIEQEGLQSLLHQRPIDCDVALAPHHGSPHSDPARFAAWCSPQWMIVSGGHGEAVGPVVAAIEKLGVNVRHTATFGAVRVTLSRTEMNVSPWSYPP